MEPEPQVRRGVPVPEEEPAVEPAGATRQEGGQDLAQEPVGAAGAGPERRNGSTSSWQNRPPGPRTTSTTSPKYLY